MSRGLGDVYKRQELEYMEKGIQVLQEQGIDVFQLINDNNLGDSVAKVTQAIINL